MLKSIKQFYNLYPLPVVMVVSLVVRMFSVIFSKGYGMHDDHFLIIEAAQSWVDGYDYNAWFPWTPGNKGPSGHSLFYVGLHFVFFKFLNSVGIINPQTKMFLVRLIHALFSLTVIYWGYKISFYISKNIRFAINTAWMLGLYWFMPMLSVRNLVEVVCVPFLMCGTWLLVKNTSSKNGWLSFVAGLVSGLAFSVRFQTLFFLGGMGLSLLLLKQFKHAFYFGLGLVISMVIIQSIPDYFLWKRPFAELTEYVRYNLENATTYFNKPWYMYVVLLLGVLIPPFSFFLIFGFFKEYKNQLLLFLPTFCFLVFHSYFPNKQERFIFPVIPFLIILGYYGWELYRINSIFWQKNSGLYNRLLIFCLVINFIALPVVTTAYTKRSRVEAMVFLRKRGDVTGLIIEDSNHEYATLTPRFYLGKWKFPEYVITSTQTPAMLADFFIRDKSAVKPNYILVYEEENLSKRLQEIKKYFPNISLVAKIDPGFLDVLLHKLNPRNKNAACYIYSIQF
jgi:hypothetical protein